MIRWLQTSDKALISEGGINPGNWFGTSLLNSGVCIYNETVFLYFRGPEGTDNGYHSIGCWSQPVTGFDPWDLSKWTMHGVVLEPTDVSGVSGSSRRLTNCSAVVYGGKIRLYFNVMDENPFRNHTASSTDGITFTDDGPCQALGADFGGGGSGCVDVDGTLWMLHGNASATQGFEIAARKSIDGVEFTDYVDSVITPDGSDAFTGYSMVTSRLVYEDPYIYAFVPSSPVHDDYPESVGVWRAHKSDHSTWEEYDRNPVYMRDAGGKQAEAAVWSWSVIKINGVWWAFYEGAGSRSEAGTTISNNTRDIPYYNYFTDSWSQVFAARMNTSMALAELWDLGSSATPYGDYVVQNMKTRGYLATLDGAVTSGRQLATYADVATTGTTWNLTENNSQFRFNNSAFMAAVENNTRIEGANIVLLGDASLDNREWHLVPLEQPRERGGLYRIINRRNGMCMSVDKDASGDASLVSVREYDGSSSQTWLLKPIA